MTEGFHPAVPTIFDNPGSGPTFAYLYPTILYPTTLYRPVRVEQIHLRPSEPDRSRNNLQWEGPWRNRYRRPQAPAPVR